MSAIGPVNINPKNPEKGLIVFINKGPVTGFNVSIGKLPFWSTKNNFFRDKIIINNGHPISVNQTINKEIEEHLLKTKIDFSNRTEISPPLRVIYSTNIKKNKKMYLN